MVKKLNGEICKNGYKRIHTTNKGKEYKLLVHRLVAGAFIPNPNNLPCVNHKDGNKLNNSVENLEWCTYSQNNKHAYKTGLKSAKGEDNGKAKLTTEEVLEIRRLYQRKSRNGYNSYKLAKLYGVSPKCILDVVNYRRWKHI